MLTYYIIDTETTGRNANWHEVTQVSLIRCSDRYQLNRYIRAQYPERAEYQALKITGRTKQDLYRGVSQLEAIEACEAFLALDQRTPEHRCMIGHNVNFDRRFAHKLWSNHKKEFPAVCWLDTMYSTNHFMTRHLGLIKPKKGLHDALQNCGLKPRSGAHDAVSDTQNTYILHQHLLKEGFDFLPYIKRIPHELIKKSSLESAVDDSLDDKNSEE